MAKGRKFRKNMQNGKGQEISKKKPAKWQRAGNLEKTCAKWQRAGNLGKT